MDDLVVWLRAQLDEDERVATAATAGPWRAHDTHLGQYGHTATVLSGEGNATDLRAWLPSHSHEPWDETRNVWNDAAHIARHDPARVLREIDAKRQIMRKAFEHAATIDGEWGCCHDAEAIEAGRCDEQHPDHLPLLALPYADRPGYQESWRP
ncbi:DUF6221 family protein [Streptomyces sp. NPDC004250]|uniref:DUF6221 family protein n=1 Tax=Streptomyces sp. NPDC004250 TaxID=3364692 RepID=UPI00368D8028